MSSSPPLPSSQPSISESYAQLTALLSPPSTILEIDFLPSTYPPHIHYEHPALGLPKSLLVKLYLHARTIFFSKDQDGESHYADNELHQGEEDAEDREKRRLKASAILLLFDPNHLSAINHRKRYINSHLSPNNARASIPHDDPSSGREKEEEAILPPELTLLTSFLTSPLYKHAKSSTLWAYRLWLVRNYHHHILKASSHSVVRSGAAAPDAHEIRTRFWESEIDIVLRAGERHPRNYYAFEYARQLFRFWAQLSNDNYSPRALVSSLEETIRRIHTFALLHTRDISAWSFLLFLIHFYRSTGGSTKFAADTEGEKKEEEEVVRRVIWETEEWVRKYEWRGESMVWFLRGLREMQEGSVLGKREILLA